GSLRGNGSGRPQRLGGAGRADRVALRLGGTRAAGRAGRGGGRAGAGTPAWAGREAQPGGSRGGLPLRFRPRPARPPVAGVSTAPVPGIGSLATLCGVVGRRWVVTDPDARYVGGCTDWSRFEVPALAGLWMRTSPRVGRRSVRGGRCMI